MNRIQKLRKDFGLSQRELAKTIKVHQTAISQWETGKTFPDMDTAKALADYFRVSIDYILGRNASESGAGYQLPVLGVIPAGIPMEAIEDILDYVEIPISWVEGGRDYFALKISGDSMSPYYMDGDIVIFQKEDDCESGSECAVIVSKCKATIRKIIKQEAGIVLQPLNAREYDAVFYSHAEVESLPLRLIGIAKELRRKI